MNKTIMIIIGIVLLVGAFSLGFMINIPSEELEGTEILQEQINTLQLENSQLSQQVLITNQQSPGVEFTLYENVYKEGVSVIDSYYISKSEGFPKMIEKDLIINSIDLENPKQFYLNLEYKGKEEKVGFTSLGPGGLTLEIKKWEVEPSEEDKSAGIIEKIFVIYFSLLEIDYDETTNDWNYVKVGTILYSENIHQTAISSF